MGPIYRLSDLGRNPACWCAGQGTIAVIIDGHHPAAFMPPWIEAAGRITLAKTLYTYDLDITRESPPVVQRIRASTQEWRITIPESTSGAGMRVAIILAILNDAGRNNWGGSRPLHTAGSRLCRQETAPRSSRKNST